MNTFTCTPPCGSDVPVEFNHGNNGPGAITNLLGDLLAITSTTNDNECLTMKPGEECYPTCDPTYTLSGKMECIAGSLPQSPPIFQNSAECKRTCYIDRLVPNATNEDCQTKFLKPGESCKVRTKVGYSFPGNKQVENIVCDEDGDIHYPVDPAPDCGWSPIQHGSIEHCLRNKKDTILNVQGQCKDGQIIRNEEECRAMFEYVDNWNFTSQWDFVGPLKTTGKTNGYFGSGRYNVWATMSWSGSITYYDYGWGYCTASDFVNGTCSNRRETSLYRHRRNKAPLGCSFHKGINAKWSYSSYMYDIHSRPFSEIDSGQRKYVGLDNPINRWYRDTYTGYGKETIEKTSLTYSELIGKAYEQSDILFIFCSSLI